MIEPVVVFLLYGALSALGVFLLLGAWIRFGDTSDLDPKSFLVRLFSKKPLTAATIPASIVGFGRARELQNAREQERLALVGGLPGLADFVRQFEVARYFPSTKKVAKTGFRYVIADALSEKYTGPKWTLGRAELQARWNKRLSEYTVVAADSPVAGEVEQKPYVELFDMGRRIILGMERSRPVAVPLTGSPKWESEEDFETVTTLADRLVSRRRS